MSSFIYKTIRRDFATDFSFFEPLSDKFPYLGLYTFNKIAAMVSDMRPIAAVPRIASKS